MLLKKLESFLLVLTFGLFLFSCTIEENKVKENPTPTTSEYKISIEITNTDSLGKSRFVFTGTIDGNPLYIQEDSVGIGSTNFIISSKGLLKIEVRAYSLLTGEMTASAIVEREISGDTSFDIELESVAFSDMFTLILNNAGNETKQLYNKNEPVGQLPSPRKDGYIFNGWYTEQNGSGTKLTSTYSMTSDLTVYAWWTENSPGTSYTVTFNTNGGSTVASKTVAANATIEKPADPRKDGYTFTGWYKESSLNNSVSFPYTVTGNVTLYAKWTASESVVKVTGVRLDQSSVTINGIGNTINLVPIVEPSDATNKSVTWSSDNTSVATVNNGEITSVAAGTAKITVTTDDGGFKAECTVTVNNNVVSKSLKRLTVSKASSSTETAPAFTATAYWSDSTEQDVTTSADWKSSDTAVATVSNGTVTLVSAGKTDITGSYTDGGVTKKGAVQTLTVTEATASLVVYMDAGYGEVTGGGYLYGWKDTEKPFGAWPGTKMTLTDDGKAYYFIIEDAAVVELIIINNNSGKQTDNLTLPGTNGHYLCYHTGSKWDWEEYTGTKVPVPGGGALTATITAGEVTEPMEPEVTISPASGNISLSGSIKVTFTNGNDTISSAKVTINGTQFDMGKTAGTFTKTLADLGITTGGTTITVSASVTNGEGTTTANATLTTTETPAIPDTFTWDNVNCYFVLTDRFYNGDEKNDHSYYRQNKDNNQKLASGYNNVATFHGGDIKGLTDKLDYLDKLGVNAIWITAPYEQAHGWCSGGGNGFPHYAFHGYYTLDWTYMDQNMGTIEEFRTFVDEAHKRGIRIVMDVVMNHTGYNTVEDMLTYNFGDFNQTPTHGWIGNGTWKDNHTITIYDQQGKWGNWWGCWVRAFSDQSWASSAGYAHGGSGDLTGPLSGLPDVVTEKTDSVNIPTFLKTKWANETDSKTVPSETGNTCGNKYGDYKLNSISNVDWNGKSGDWRTDKKGAPTDYQVMWLSGWVREFGIDGFRCDTAKHIDMYRWGQLKKACQSALEAWRKDSSKADSAGAKKWDENFWMTGEHFGWTSKDGQGDYYTTGGFDSMIGFGIGGGDKWHNSGYNYHNPSISESTWGSYLSINNNQDSDNNGNRNNILTYISSHDTRLSRTNDQSSLGTMFVLLPGGVQIYYGDETSREKQYTDCGDGDMATRGDFDWAAENGATAVHWGKVGTFRKYNPAVGAGTGSATKRSYSGSAGESKVAIGISGMSVDVSGLFNDGTTVYNWYDGKSAQVSGGKVSFSGGTTSQPILVSDRNPADYGVKF